MTATKPLLQIRVDPETVERIDRLVNRADQKPWEPKMTRATFLRKAIHNELQRAETQERKEAA